VFSVSPSTMVIVDSYERGRSGGLLVGKVPQP